jgi:hypothetical protein
MLAFLVGFIGEMFHRSNGDPDCPQCHGTGRRADYSTRTMRDCGCGSATIGSTGTAPTKPHVLRWIVIGAIVIFVVLPVLASL